MAKQVQARRGTATQNDALTGAVGEVTVDTTNDSLRVHDGSTAGGFETLRADMDNYDGTRVTGTLNVTDLDANGTVTADGLTVDGSSKFSGSVDESSSGGLSLKLGLIDASISNSTDAFVGVHNSGGIGSLAGDLLLAPRSSTGVDNSIRLFSGQTTPKLRQLIASNGDVSFYDSAGSSQSFFWDASAESLGIGTSSPSGALTIEKASSDSQINLKRTGTGTANGWIWANSDKIRFGDDSGGAPNNTRMCIETNTGRVGIGTSSPATALDVVGTVTADGLTVDGTTDLNIGTANIGIDMTSTDEGSYIQIKDNNATGFYFGARAGSFDVYDTDNNAILKANSNGDISFYEDTGTSPKMVWKSADERLGIGTSSPDTLLHLSANTGATLTLESTDTAIATNEVIGTIDFYSNDASGIGAASRGSISLIAQDAAGAGSMVFKTSNASTASTERLRLDASGNLLVGKTSSGSNIEGVELLPQGAIYAVRSGNVTGVFNRKSSDGNIVDFRKDGSTVGSIGVNNGTNFYQAANAGAGLKMGSANIVASNASGASNDNAIDLGSSSTRFQDIYATNGTIQTSDRNEKQDIEALSDAEQRVAVAAKGLLRKFRWKDAVAEKGDDARIHFGIIAQDLQDAFAAEGLDAGRYAMFTSTTWTDEETGEERTRMGVRYSELLAFIIAAI